MGLHVHPGFNVTDASSLRYACAFNLDRTHAADSDRRESRVMA
jgi:hypothetical protein